MDYDIKQEINSDKRSLNKSEQVIYNRLKKTVEEIKLFKNGKIELQDANEFSKSFKVFIASEFAKEAKRILKKHLGIRKDIAELVSDLAINPFMGTEIGYDFYIIRLANAGTNKGKSGGARIITYVILDKKTVLLVEIYLKNEYDSANVSVLIKRLQYQGLIKLSMIFKLTPPKHYRNYAQKKHWLFFQNKF